MITLRARILIIVSLVMLLILGIAIALYVVGKRAPAAVPAATETAPGGAPTNNVPVIPGKEPTPTAGIPVKPISSEEVNKNAAKQLAKIFVERYFSYSTDSNWQNVYDVKNLSTTNLWNTISASIKTPASGSFRGATTKVYASTLNNFSASAATVYLQVIQTNELVGQATSTHRNITVNMVKIGDNWLADKFEWEK